MTRLFALWVALLMTGCSIGPKAIEHTHGQYSLAVQRVEEEEFLRNVVRLRYLEEPSNLDISAIAAQYELAFGAEARPFFGTDATSTLIRSFERFLPFASLSGSERPTVSMIPQENASTVRQFLTPISADTLVFLTQAGWPASSILCIWVDRLNGVPNRVPLGLPPRELQTDFRRFKQVVDVIQVAQDRELASIRAEERGKELSGPLPAESITATAVVEAAKAGFEYQPTADGKTWKLLKKERRLVLQINPTAKTQPELLTLAEMLNLKPNEDRYDVEVASGDPDPALIATQRSSTIRLTPRSTAQAVFYLANGVEVPPEHLAQQLAPMPKDGSDPMEITQGLFRVHSSAGHKHLPPKSAYVAVWYRDHWYYIDDHDHETKATLFLMLQLRQLDFKRQEIGRVPALTLPLSAH